MILFTHVFMVRSNANAALLLPNPYPPGVTGIVAAHLRKKDPGKDGDLPGQIKDIIVGNATAKNLDPPLDPRTPGVGIAYIKDTVSVSFFISTIIDATSNPCFPSVKLNRAFIILASHHLFSRTSKPTTRPTPSASENAAEALKKASDKANKLADAWSLASASILESVGAAAGAFTAALLAKNQIHTRPASALVIATKLAEDSAVAANSSAVAAWANATASAAAAASAETACSAADAAEDAAAASRAAADSAANAASNAKDAEDQAKALEASTTEQRRKLGTSPTSAMVAAKYAAANVTVARNLAAAAASSAAAAATASDEAAASAQVFWDYCGRCIGTSACDYANFDNEGPMCKAW